MAKPILERLQSKFTVDKATGCWVWHGAKANKSDKWIYGVIQHNKKLQMAHRVMYELVNGEVEKGLHLDHLCRNTRCINPAHLEPVSPKENINRGERNGNFSECIRGHKMAGDNLYLDKKGHRECRICRKMQWENYKERLANRQKK